MPFEKKPIEEKMVRFSTTLTPESYYRLKQASEDQNKPMSEVLSAMIMKALPSNPLWVMKLWKK